METGKVIINADEKVICPSCNHEFDITEGITRHTLDKHEAEFNDLVAAKRKELENRLEAKAKEKAEKDAAENLAKLTNELNSAREAEKLARESIEQAKNEARLKVTEELNNKAKILEEDLIDKNRQIQTFRDQELALRKQKRELEEKQENAEIELVRRLDDEKKRIAEEIIKKESDKTNLLEAEWRKKFEDAQAVNEALKRKLEQGSQQLQGEVFEVMIETSLTTKFHHDLIEEVKKGIRGADVIQTVRTPNGTEVGKIIWEAKRAENWSDKWITKLKEDQQEVKADIAVLITTVMPKGGRENFNKINDVWVISPEIILPMAETLRVVLLEAHKIRQANIGKSEKVDLIFDYLTSNAFAQRMNSVFDTFKTMQAELDAEKRAMQRIWAKRQTQINSVYKNMNVITGELQGISENAIAGLLIHEELIQLAGPDEVEDN